MKDEKQIWCYSNTNLGKVRFITIFLFSQSLTNLNVNKTLRLIILTISIQPSLRRGKCHERVERCSCKFLGIG